MKHAQSTHKGVSIARFSTAVAPSYRIRGNAASTSFTSAAAVAALAKAVAAAAFTLSLH